MPLFVCSNRRPSLHSSIRSFFPLSTYAHLNLLQGWMIQVPAALCLCFSLRRAVLLPNNLSANLLSDTWKKAATSSFTFCCCCCCWGDDGKVKVISWSIVACHVKLSINFGVDVVETLEISYQQLRADNESFLRVQLCNIQAFNHSV